MTTRDSRASAPESSHTLRLSIDDDGDGGADPARGPGIIGLIDRVDALGGKLTLRSPRGEGTVLVVELPVEPGCGP